MRLPWIQSDDMDMKLKVIIVITLLFIPVGTVFATVPQWYCPNYHQLKSRALGGDNKAEIGRAHV